MKRRSALIGVAGLASGLSALAQQNHDPFGAVRPPQAAPDLRLTSDDGKPASLAQLLRGHTTAVQLMFTGCSATCPIQGALFGAVAPKIAATPGLRLLSLSIDPLGDSPAALRAWLKRFGAQAPLWRAAVPRVEDVDRLLDFVRGRSNDGADRHTAQVYLFDRQARLAYRTAQMPPATFVADMLGQLAHMN